LSHPRADIASVARNDPPLEQLKNFKVFWLGFSKPLRNLPRKTSQPVGLWKPEFLQLAKWAIVTNRTVSRGTSLAKWSPVRCAPNLAQEREAHFRRTLPKRTGSRHLSADGSQLGRTLTRMFLKQTLLIWPGIGGCPWRAKVPSGSQVAPLERRCTESASGIW
jgi:hypothetical protein